MFEYASLLTLISLLHPVNRGTFNLFEWRDLGSASLASYTLDMVSWTVTGAGTARITECGSGTNVFFAGGPGIMNRTGTFIEKTQDGLLTI